MARSMTLLENVVNLAVAVGMAAASKAAGPRANPYRVPKRNKPARGIFRHDCVSIDSDVLRKTAVPGDPL